MNIQLRMLVNQRKQGRVATNDRFSLSKGGLTFNEITRKKLNIHLPTYVQFFVDKNSENEGVFYLRIVKQKGAPNLMSVVKSGKYYHIAPPTEAKELGLVFKKKGEVVYKSERINLGSHRSYIKLTPVAKG